MSLTCQSQTHLLIYYSYAPCREAGASLTPPSTPSSLQTHPAMVVREENPHASFQTQTESSSSSSFWIVSAKTHVLIEMFGWVRTGPVQRTILRWDVMNQHLGCVVLSSGMSVAGEQSRNRWNQLMLCSPDGIKLLAL